VHERAQMGNRSRKEIDFKPIISWWESKRLLFNVLLVGFCVIVMYAFWDSPMRDIRGNGPIIVQFVFGVFGANIVYTAGWFVEVVLSYLFDLKEVSNLARWFFFICGTLAVLFSAFVFIGLEFDVPFNK